MRYIRNINSEHMDIKGISPVTTYIIYRVEFVEEISKEALFHAYQDVVACYPVFGFGLEREDGMQYLVDLTVPVKVHNTDQILFPDGKSLDGHLVFIGYSGTMMNLVINHRLTDGHGISIFLGKLLERYELWLSGTAVAITEPAYDISLMVQQTAAIPVATEDQPYEPFVHPGEVLRLPSAAGKTYYTHVLYVDEKDFIALAHSKGASPFVMMNLLIADGLFRMNPDSGTHVSVGFSISNRKALGMEGSFSNIVEHGVLSIGRDEPEDSDHLERMKNDVKGQASPENFRFCWKDVKFRFTKTYRIITQSSYFCSYLRMKEVRSKLVKEHYQLNPCSRQQVSVNACLGRMEFIVSGPTGCDTLYPALKLGLEGVGLKAVEEKMLTMEDGGDRLILHEK